MRYVCADKIILYFGKKIAVSFLLNYVCGILKKKKHLCIRVWGTQSACYVVNKDTRFYLILGTPKIM